MGLDCIEWLFDAEDYEQNPLWTDEGIKRIKHLIQLYGVTVQSVCATYFMARPLFRVSAKEQTANEAVLKRLIDQAAQISVKVILIPVLENTEIRSNAEADRLENALRGCLPVARARGIRLSLETELPVDSFIALIERFGDPFLGAYYDIGNATAKGYDLAHDIRALGSAIYGLHIKDRKLNGPNVFLGQGDVDLTRCFLALQEVKYQGPLILETAFGADYMRIAAAHRLFVQDHWNEALKQIT